MSIYPSRNAPAYKIDFHDPKFNENESISDFIYSINNVQQQLIREYEEVIGKCACGGWYHCTQLLNSSNN